MFSSTNRKKTFALYYTQYLIATRFQEKIIFSVSPDFYLDFCRTFENLNEKHLSETLFQHIDDFFMDYDLPHRMQRMLRFSTDATRIHFDEDIKRVETLTLSQKELFFDLYVKRGRKYKEKQWKIFEPIVREGRFFYFPLNQTIAAYAYISDIVDNGGNIVVATSPEFRNQGLGKAVVAKAADWCFEHAVIPVYLVSCGNKPSIRLADSLGFERKAGEIIVSSFQGV